MKGAMELLSPHAFSTSISSSDTLRRPCAQRPECQPAPGARSGVKRASARPATNERISAARCRRPDAARRANSINAGFGAW